MSSPARPRSDSAEVRRRLVGTGRQIPEPAVKASARSPRAAADPPCSPARARPPGQSTPGSRARDGRTNRRSCPAGNSRTSGPGQSLRASRRPTSGIARHPVRRFLLPLDQENQRLRRPEFRSGSAAGPSRHSAGRWSQAHKRTSVRQPDHSSLGQARHCLVNHVARIVTLERSIHAQRPGSSVIATHLHPGRAAAPRLQPRMRE